ncbi:MAG: hypothetical protein WBQ03_14585 [Candidatus Sulfotelmatobacter sp.]
MGMNKQQMKAAEKKAKQERLLALEEEIGKRELGKELQELGGRDVVRMSEAELDSAIKEREALLEPKQEVKAATATATPEPAMSKQMLTVLKLTVALREQRQIELLPEQLKQDGKYVLINVGEGWPTIRVGSNGGVVLPQIRSYKEGMETWMKADELLKKQTERDAKKAATAASQPAVAA